MKKSRVLDELKFAESKREIVRKSLEQAQAKVSDIVSFTLRWKDLEDHFELVKSDLEKRSREVELKEKQIETSLQERVLKIEAAEALASVLKIEAEGVRREIDAKQADLGLLRSSIQECETEFSSKRRELVQMQQSKKDYEGELDLKEKQLEQTKSELERYCNQLGVEKENLGNIQRDYRHCKDLLDRNTKDLSHVLELLQKSRQQITSVEEQLGSQQNLLQIRTLELELKEKELNATRELIQSCNLDIELKRREVQSLDDLNKNFDAQFKSKSKELSEIQTLIEEQTHELALKLKHRDSIDLMIQKSLEEFAVNEKRREEMSETLRCRSLEIESKEKKYAQIEESIKQCAEELRLKEKDVESTERKLKQCTMDLKAKEQYLVAVKDTLKKCCEDVESKQREFNSLRSRITEQRKLESSIEELNNKLCAKQDELSSIQKLVKECSEEVEMKKKKRDLIETLIKDVTEELASKENELSSVKMKIQEGLKELESNEERHNRLGVLLKEREEELALKQKQLEHKEEYDKNFLRSIEHKEEKNVKLLLNGYLKLWPKIHGEVSEALQASSDPAMMVLEMIQGFKEAEYGECVVVKSGICLLECLVAISPEIKPHVQKKAIEFASELKTKTRWVKEEGPAKDFRFMHFLTAFGLAYALDINQLQSLMDVRTTQVYAPSVCKALGLSPSRGSEEEPAAATCSKNDVLSSDAKPEPPPPLDELKISQNTAAASELVSQSPSHRDVLMQVEAETLSHDEVSNILHSEPNPARFVLDLMKRAVTGTHWNGEAGFEKCQAKYCVLLLEALMKLPQKGNADLRFEATKLAIQWRGKMIHIGNPIPLETLSFLQFLVAFSLVDIFNPDEIFKLASSVAYYTHAPKLFHSLGLSSVISDFVLQLVREEHYIPAARFICSFKLNKMSPIPIVQKVIEDLTQSANDINMDKTLNEFRGKGQDFWKMRAISELIADYKLDINLPSDLIDEFLLKRGNQTENDLREPQSTIPTSQPPGTAELLYRALNSESPIRVRVKRDRTEAMPLRSQVRQRRRFH